MTTKEELGQRVRELREQGDRTQQAVAMLMAVKMGQAAWRQTTVARIEAGERVLQATEVAPLAQALGCSIHALLGLPEPTSNDVALRALEEVLVSTRRQYRELGGDAKWGQ